ncbi:MAG: hypothetical protein EZS26_003744 [Candidatus Ordinivivax streblomastigis]|uniref:Cupin type-2 domain-containing protein n=1 Tax=Candidatus Ordinivivax streblomastigis TaxID=2540710 RepID=A0A5M8NU34_9BACT|nr:MAG: hypothetical protein EZS26_003744 [Candidatus Ordinivivax streblomastigis]
MKTIKTVLMAIVAIVIISCNNLKTKEMTAQNAIFPKGEIMTANFVGTAYVKMLVADADSTFDTQVYDVTFERGTRNNWHSHPGGQLLLCTAGEGYYQERGKPIQLLKVGDVVEIRPNIEHWHGATPDSEFTHIGITTQVSKSAAVWLEPVSDEAYNSLNNKYNK